MYYAQQKKNGKTNWFSETKRIYELIKSEKRPYDVSILNKRFIVLPGVFSPKYFNDTEYFATELPTIAKKGHLLEIGTGTGIIAIICAIHGLKVVATDINSRAVKNAILNSKKQSVSVDIRKGNLFKCISKNEKFDYIFWNHPWNKDTSKRKEILLKAGFDYKYEMIHKFIKESKKHITRKGKVLIGTGGFADIKDMTRYAKKEGYFVKCVRKKCFNLGNRSKKTYFMIYQLSLRED